MERRKITSKSKLKKILLRIDYADKQIIYYETLRWNLLFFFKILDRQYFIKQWKEIKKGWKQVYKNELSIIKLTIKKND